VGIKVKHLAGAQETIDDSTKIIRYMKLSTLLLLLADRVFLPSLRCLQSHDKLEGLLPDTPSVYRDYGETLYPRIKHCEDWLLQQAGEPKKIPANGSRRNAVRLSFLAKLWLEQLSIRRCVWCWNRHTGLSHALWKIYGQRGVALVSTVGEVMRAFPEEFQLRAIVSPVSYSIPRGLPIERFVDEVEKASSQMMREENLPFPYLFKEAGYRYEDEVRFVFGVHPNLLTDHPGILIEIDGKSLVKNFVGDLWIAPDTPREEVGMIRALVKKLREGTYPDFQYPGEWDQERLVRFQDFGGTPFTISDHPSGLFIDLD
jgi:hypothetical protein